VPRQIRQLADRDGKILSRPRQKIMSKKENLDVNYLNKFDKARPESAEEARFNREMEINAAEDVNSLIKNGQAVVKERLGGKDGQELEDLTVVSTDGEIVYYENKKLLKNTIEKKADFSDVNEPMTLIAVARINEALKSGKIIQEEKYDKDGKTLEEATIKLVDGTIVSYLNIKGVQKISKESAERQAVAQKIAQEKQGGRLQSDNN
jgi:hypothetical protein